MHDLRISFSSPPAGARRLSDDEFFRRMEWEPAADAPADRAGLLRRVRKAFAKPVAGEPAVLWSRQAYPEARRTAELLGALEDRTGRGERRLVQWLSSAASGEAASPVEPLALLELLRDRSAGLPDDVLWRLWREALTCVVESLGADEHQSRPATDDQRLVLDGELPFAAGLAFGAVRGAGVLRQSGAQALNRALAERTDGDGTPDAGLMERLAFWLAPLVRSAERARQARAELWDEEGRQRFRSVLKMASPLCVAGGRLALSNGFSGSRTGMLLRGLRLAGWAAGQPPVRAVRLAGGRAKSEDRTSGGASRSFRSDVLPVIQSDHARVACLRSDWTPRADTLAVTHHEPFPRLDLTAAGRPLLAGAWEIDVSVGGEAIPIEEEWSCVCWHSDEDGDYLELQIHFEGGPRIERQLLLSREGRFLVLADAVSEAGAARIDYAARLPLAKGVSAAPDSLTREVRLAGPRLAARAFPLALPCERVDGAAGGFAPGGDRLEYRHAALGGLYAPLVLDWHPDRRKAEAEWKPLTVTEDRRILRGDAAAAYRLRLAAHQLLVYRALSRTGESRAVLGHHTPHETVIGRFDAEGTVTPIVYVE